MMRLVPATPHNTFCKGCRERITVGQHGNFYAELSVSVYPTLYCEDCAVAIVTYEDPTRSVKQFYADVDGKAVAV